MITYIDLEAEAIDEPYIIGEKNGPQGVKSIYVRGSAAVIG